MYTNLNNSARLEGNRPKGMYLEIAVAADDNE
jgi:hypothetical protein